MDSISHRCWFAHEPRGSAYRQLVTLGEARCTHFLLVVRPRMGLAEKGRDILYLLRPYLEAQWNASKWPGTELVGHQARVLRFRFAIASARILRDAVGGLYEWQHPFLPEDLAFLRDDGRTFLGSIAHEREGFLCLSP